MILLETEETPSILMLADGSAPHPHPYYSQFISILEGALELCQEFNARDVLRTTGRDYLMGAVEVVAAQTNRKIVSLRQYDRYEAGLAAMNALNLIFQGYEVYDFGGGTEGFVIAAFKAADR